MQNKLLLIFLLICSLMVSCSTPSTYNKINTNETNEISNDKKNAHNLVNSPKRSGDDTITIEEIAEFLELKEEHYPLSDEFIERYQQNGGGYIDNAKKAGLVVDKYLHEPNQKWHFFYSWLYPSIEDNTLKWTEDAKSRVYSKLLCPELLLWIYEACGVDPSLVKEAKDIAEAGKASNKAVTSIAKDMRNIVSWDAVKAGILNTDAPTVTKYTVSINSSEDFSVSGLSTKYVEGSNVSFKVNISSSSKKIDSVVVDGTTLSSTDGNYTFTMPNRDVNITISLTDKDASDYIATSVSLSSASMNLFIGGNSKTLTATVLPSDTSDIPTWSIIEGDNVILLSQNGNEATVTPKNVGFARVQVTYNSNVSAICEINVKEQTSERYITTYNAICNQGAFSSGEQVFNALVKDGDGEGILSSVTNINQCVYGKGNGGRGETAWSSSNLIKLGTTSVIGTMTLNLKSEIKGIKITGYVHNSSLKFRVGDSSSSDWEGNQPDNKTTLKEKTGMSVVSKATIEANQTSTIEVSFAPTDSIKIATENTYPLYITSIEFIVD